MNRNTVIVAGAMVAFLAANVAFAMSVDTAGGTTGDTGGETVAAGEAAIVEAHCYRFRYMAGHAVANIEAAHEVLDEKLSEFDPLGMDIRLSDYVENADGLRELLDRSCSAPTLDEAKSYVTAFRTEAERIRNQFAGLQDLIRGDLENYIAEHQAQIRAAYEEELKVEVADLEQEARNRLEAQLRAEAESRKQSMIDRIQKDVEAELIAEYGGQENPDIPYLQRLGEERGRARGEAEAAQVEAELRTKYEKLADLEVERLKAAAEEKAKDKEAELRNMMTGLEGVGETINQVAQRKFDEEWAAYEDEADEAGRQVYRAFVEEEFDRARSLILAEGDLVESVPQEMRDRYGLRTTQDLLDELDADEREVLATLANVTGITDDQAKAFGETFSEKWIALRERLGNLKARSPDLVLRQIERALERSPGAESGGVDRYLVNTRKAMLDRKTTLDFIGNKCATDPKYAASNCAACNTLVERRDLADYGLQVAKKIDECSAIIAELDGKRAAAEAGTLAVADAMVYGRRVETCLTDLRAMRDPYLEFKALYDKTLSNRQRSCR